MESVGQSIDRSVGWIADRSVGRSVGYIDTNILRLLLYNNIVYC
jgi:hypothetical protein